MNDIPIDLLRTFLTLVETTSFTRTGELMGRSQPAISHQIKRLEDLIGTQLYIKESSLIKITADGDILASYARECLKIQDSVKRVFHRGVVDRKRLIRIGASMDFSHVICANIIRNLPLNFEVDKVDIIIDRNVEIVNQFVSGDIDIAIVCDSFLPKVEAYKVWDSEIVWIAGTNTIINKENSISLFLNTSCQSVKEKALGALEKEGIDFQLDFTTTACNVIFNAVKKYPSISGMHKHSLLKEWDGQIKVLSDTHLPVMPNDFCSLLVSKRFQKPAYSDLVNIFVKSVGGLLADEMQAVA
ncbi:MAG: LysR family transcriptional regulator [Halopseudomonas aestusnigri]